MNFHDFYNGQVVLMASVACVLASFYCLRFLPLPFVLFGGYLGLTCIYPVPPAVQGIVGFYQFRELIFLALSAIAATAISESLMRRILAWAVPLMALSTLLGYPLIKNNTSMNAALLVAMLPFVSKLNLVLILPVIFLKQGGISAGIMLIALGLLEVESIYLAVAIAIPGVTWVCYHYSKLFDGWRFDLWVATGRFFIDHISPWVGAGLGTFMLYGPSIHAQSGRPFTSGYMLSLHNDWGQLFFETGAIGFLLGTWCLVYAWRKASQAVMQSITLMAILGAVYFPMQVPVMAFFCVWLVMTALTEPPRRLTSNV